MQLISPRNGVYAAILLSSCLLITGCAPPGVARAAKPILDVSPNLEPYPRPSTVVVSLAPDGCVSEAKASGNERATVSERAWSLKGDENFDPARLELEMRCWYEQLWTVLETPELYRRYTERARSDDLYLYSRSLNTHMNALLAALRVTGDLALLDEIDRLAQHMRSVLDDSWRGPAAFDSDGIDGYLNWVWSQSTSSSHRGKDLHATDEMRTHAMVAQFAWAFRINEGLDSPNGVDYRERADFWQTYLVDHFEAKWRERSGVEWPEFPFLTRPHTHETMEFVRFNHYMYLLTGRNPYQGEAQRLSKLSFDNFREAETDNGSALVVPRSVLALGGKEDFLLPSTYVRYVYASVVDLYFEGVDPWNDPAILTMLSRSLGEFIIDNGTEDFARDMGGGLARGGVRASAEEDWPRFGAERFNTSPYVFLTAWDQSGKIADVATTIYAGISPDRRDIFVPVGMLVDLAVN